MNKRWYFSRHNAVFIPLIATILQDSFFAVLYFLFLLVQSLAGGETKAAVAGGMNVMLAAPTTARICLLQALSHVGRCRSFDAAGDGYGRGEGFTVALLRWATP